VCCCHPHVLLGAVDRLEFDLAGSIGKLGNQWVVGMLGVSVVVSERRGGEVSVRRERAHEESIAESDSRLSVPQEARNGVLEEVVALE
jgi:hypothetical protein